MTILDRLGGTGTEAGTADVALSGELGAPSARGWPSVPDQSTDSPSTNTMPRGYREDGTQHSRSKPSRADSFRRH